MSATELAAVANWPDYSITNLQYGLLAKDIAAESELSLRDDDNQPLAATYALAASADQKLLYTGDDFRWRLHKDVAVALAHLEVALMKRRVK